MVDDGLGALCDAGRDGTRHAHIADARAGAAVTKESCIRGSRADAHARDLEALSLEGAVEGMALGADGRVVAVELERGRRLELDGLAAEVDALVDELRQARQIARVLELEAVAACAVPAGVGRCREGILDIQIAQAHCHGRDHRRAQSATQDLGPARCRRVSHAPVLSTPQARLPRA